MSISVCMASYSGSRFIAEQIKTILPELGAGDELVIVDDCSPDSTVSEIKNFEDDRIKLHQNDHNYGHVLSFNRALTVAKNRHIFLSDQDDLWIEGRVGMMQSALQENNALLLSSNFLIFEDNKDSNYSNAHPVLSSRSNSNFRNIFNLYLGRLDYFGSAMLLDRRILDVVLPIPRFVESHDWWIATAANMLKRNYHLEAPTLLRRLHGNNVSDPGRRHLKKIITRMKCIKMMIYLSSRIREQSRKTE